MYSLKDRITNNIPEKYKNKNSLEELKEVLIDDYTTHNRAAYYQYEQLLALSNEDLFELLDYDIIMEKTPQEKLEELGYEIQFLKNEIRIYSPIKKFLIASIDKTFKGEKEDYSKELSRVLDRVKRG